MSVLHGKVGFQMDIKRWRPERGQTLVILALSITVLMLMAGLAVDVGMAYNERRTMQNAADAAALAGAQRLCDDQGEAAAISAATSAGLLNGAAIVTATTTLTEDARSVHAIASTDSPTYFFRLVGVLLVPVRASATAECSCASSVGGAWPIAFDQPEWDALGCMNDDGTIEGASPHIIVWADDNADIAALYGHDLCDYCGCTPFNAYGIYDGVMSYGGNPMGPGDRGWIQLESPPGFEDDPIWGGVNCTGTDTLAVWMQYGYPGLIAQGKCVPTKPGVSNPALQAGAASEFDDVGIVIYDPTPDTPCTTDDLIGECDGTRLLKVVDTGCVRVQKIYYTPGNDLTLPQLDGTGTCRINGDWMKNEKAILASRLCDCPYSGSGYGGGSGTTCVPAVTLTQ